MYKMVSKKTIAITISMLLIFSLISALATLPRNPAQSSNQFEFSELFSSSFQKFPVPLNSYSISHNYIDSIIDSASFTTNPQNVIGFSELEEANIVLIESDGNITEIVVDDKANILEINTFEMKTLASRDFSASGELIEGTVIELYELEIPLPNSNNSSFLTVNALGISHESWKDENGCKRDINKKVRLKGLFFVDSSDNVLVTGNSEVFTNCTLLSVTEAKSKSQSGEIVGEFINSVKWGSKGLFISSESERESHIVVDKFLNIEIWVTEDSWMGWKLF
ncbi:hypothetical protein J2755_000529 [Methanohalophilus levihalophilus]|uniref:hypothetical protein n=1 Tax=Methanohalophilus levihalophilus TaxID=1431282 RepID=UPI001AE58243|nr:hypothetical protein [Methanohalophilus levihalophilus]MBP2029609.1 hypothetical protein [Methanohalophilus levihalophilus]